jgi:hypothetical protein
MYTAIVLYAQQQQSAEATVLFVAAQEKKAREAKAQADAVKAQKVRDAAAEKLKAERAATAIAAAAALAKREAQARQPLLSSLCVPHKLLRCTTSTSDVSSYHHCFCISAVLMFSGVY